MHTSSVTESWIYAIKWLIQIVVLSFINNMNVVAETGQDKGTGMKEMLKEIMEELVEEIIIRWVCGVALGTAIKKYMHMHNSN